MTMTKQIRALRAEAIESGDLAMMIMCDRALGSVDTADDYMTPEPYERAACRRALDMSQASAIGECARVIARAAAHEVTP